MKDLHSIIDHTLLKPDATSSMVRLLCEEALNYQFASVCINPCWIKEAKNIVQDVLPVCCVIGFPLGATTSLIKAQETAKAVKDGAKEIDMVLNIGYLKSGLFQFVLEDIQAVVKQAPGCTVKVILETAFLTQQEKEKACLLAIEAGAHFVKTSTGFGPSGASIEDIQFMRKIVGPTFGVKASGGIRDYQTAISMIEAGASRLGTSRSIEIIQASIPS